MNKKFLSVIRCPEPECTGSLEVTKEKKSYNGQVIDGTLKCQSCGKTHRIMDGFPILLAEQLDDNSNLQDVDREKLRSYEN